jgi:hypothetical protein
LSFSLLILVTSLSVISFQCVFFIIFCFFKWWFHISAYPWNFISDPCFRIFSCSMWSFNYIFESFFL